MPVQLSPYFHGLTFDQAGTRSVSAFPDKMSKDVGPFPSLSVPRALYSSFVSCSDQTSPKDLVLDRSAQSSHTAAARPSRSPIRRSNPISWSRCGTSRAITAPLSELCEPQIRFVDASYQPEERRMSTSNVPRTIPAGWASSPRRRRVITPHQLKKLSEVFELVDTPNLEVREHLGTVSPDSSPFALSAAC